MGVERLAEIQARREKITPGEWFIDRSVWGRRLAVCAGDVCVAETDHDGIDYASDDTEFIAAAVLGKPQPTEEER